MSNPVADTADAVLKFALYGVAVTAFKAFLRTQAAWLNLPVISKMFDMLMDAFTDKFYFFLSPIMTCGIIDYQVGAELDEYKKAEATFRAAYGSGTPESIALAQSNFEKAAGALVRFNIPKSA